MSEYRRGPYDNCEGLDRSDLAELLRYDPSTGILAWVGHAGRGGAGYNAVVNPRVTVRIYGQSRNTFGVICLLQEARRPAARIEFRDNDVQNWRWDNISPGGWD